MPDTSTRRSTKTRPATSRQKRNTFEAEQTSLRKLPALGEFLQSTHWNDALKLLELQISQRQRDRHYNTMSMFHYERLCDRADLEAQEYYLDRIASNLFYGLNSEFAAYPYPIPKTGLGIRRYVFLTYPMRALYYAIGLYLLILTDEFAKYYVKSNPHIHAYYGANLKIDKHRLVIDAPSIKYRQQHKDFLNNVRKLLRSDTDNRVILKLDIQNCFEDIAVRRLLDLLAEWVKPSQKNRLNYGLDTIEQIDAFFQIITPGCRGLPQADHDLISGFLAWLYLTFADLYIEDTIRIRSDTIVGYHICRYVDDSYISIDFAEGIPDDVRKATVSELSYQIADLLYYQFGLRLNTKTRVYWLSDEEQKAQLLSSLKRTSLGHYVEGFSDEEVTPEARLEQLFRVLSQLKTSPTATSLVPLTPGQDEVLKDAYNDSVTSLLKKPEYLERLEEVLADFDFEIVKISPREITVLLLKSKRVRDRYRRFLLNRTNLATTDVDLIIKFLAQTDFQDEELLRKIRSYPHLSQVMREFDRLTIRSGKPGFYDLTEEQCLVLLRMPDVVEQVRLRRLCEETHSYSVALNHLVNEIQCICRSLDDPKNRKYDALKVQAFLARCRVPHDVSVAVRNLFDRRNVNQVSHPGMDGASSLAVSVDEYERYRVYVGRAIQCVLKWQLSAWHVSTGSS